METHIVPVVRQWKHIVNAQSACRVTTPTEDGSLPLVVLPNGGNATFCTNSREVHVETAGLFEIVPFEHTPQLADQTYNLTSANAQSGKAVAQALSAGSAVETLPDSPAPYTLKQGATVQLTEYTDTLELLPSTLTTAQEMRVLYTPAEARTTPLIAVPDGVTLHWAGDAEPTWEVGKDYVIQLLQTAPAHIEARLFNAPQGAKLPEISPENIEALAAGSGKFATVWPGYSEADFLFFQGISADKTELKAKCIFLLSKGVTFNAPDASVFVYNNGNSSSIWNAEITCKNFTVLEPNTGFLNRFYFHNKGRVSGVYTLVCPGLVSGSNRAVVAFTAKKSLYELRLNMPKWARTLYVVANGAYAAADVAQPLSAESIIYTLSHLQDLTLLPPDADGNPISYVVRIGIDETLGVYETDPETETTRWIPTHAGVIAAANEAELKNWVVAFDPAEP